MSDLPLISIITSSLNSAPFIKGTIQCIKDNSYPLIEYIVIDGGSTDGTLDILHEAGSLISGMISERDNGIYDAWNKGLKMASGQYIAFLGAGDVYTNGGLEKLVGAALAHPNADLISSKIAIVRDDVVQRVVGRAWRWNSFRRCMNVAHPGALHSRRLFETYGEYDTSYRIAGDYEFLLRSRDSLRTAFVDDITVRMLAGGVSQTGLSVFKEVESAKIKHQAVPTLVACIDRQVGIAKELIRRNLL